ncbi:hypothetical protein [Bacteroides oleiciplenus]|uniref:Uncharacterized protein n=1 Tax=Bacteroides oleiciplenus TaxID=626931 RepID=A0A3E5BP75_9BACE|nr:hypothetical protein [Bacteroides oleiciplenus]RGN39388.1 hypothetical protein DXB65_03405 [Bacteroides oleiciplenus]
MRLFSESEAGLRSCYFANVLPKLWQSLAKAVAKVCQCGGKRLPQPWQKIGKVLAEDLQILFQRDKVCILNIISTFAV